uniref:Uncharacterized protein n=3 Tax=Wuchereria bancrofti TaxID=6293 RepID=A0A1I8E957_WUCBA
MAINPCFCWNIKDGTVTVGLWSLVYSLASLVLFGWQLNVINSCQTVTMSQANLQCEYWCPCVGASNERTSTLIQGTVYCIVQFALFSWQSYAIKYYRDITANELIPGHNTYAAYNIPSYIENYYNTSQTVFYTGTIFLTIFSTGIIFMTIFSTGIIFMTISSTGIIFMTIFSTGIIFMTVFPPVLFS